ncbi:MAG: hypothetical protein ACNI3C_11450 [Candidatus Marinarcus sp.]|uniref:hypothetical protein n=1 Tax=Candidatus Marinarcus sp. TaxID=3100987 RepID=UPI003B003FA1
MKKLYYWFNVLLTILIFSGCASKEFQTEKYFEAFTKDDILEAGKLAFLVEPKKEFVIDSYRNRLEVTRIGLIYNTLQHEDFILNVEEDECGTKATLNITGSFGVDKLLVHDLFESEHKFFWEKVNFFLNRKKELIVDDKQYSRQANQFGSFSMGLRAVETHRIITPQKDLSKCVIKNEFEKGVIKESKSAVGGIENENL